MTRTSSYVFSEENRKALCQSLVRGADMHPHLETQAIAMLRAHPERLGVAMLQAAIQNGGKGGSIIERALEWSEAPDRKREDSLAIAHAIEPRLPWPTTALRRAAMITGLLLIGDEDGLIPNDAPIHQRINLALRCFAAGATSMALALAESAWSELQEGSGRTIDRPIALSLSNNLMIFLQEANRLDEAFDVANVGRRLLDEFPASVPEEEVAAHRCRFASSAALVHFARGDLSRAISDARQAIDAGRLLVGRGHTEFRIELSRSHANLAMFLPAAGEPRAGLRQAIEAVRQARLAELADPDGGALVLGFAYESLSGAAFNAARRVLATSAINRAMRIYAQLQERPRGLEARRIASTFVNAASITDGAATAVQRHEWLRSAITLLDELDAADPGVVDLELSVACSVAAEIYSELDRLPEAIKSLENAEMRARWDQSPSGTLRRLAFRANLAAVHNAAGNRAEAFAIKTELEERLAALTPQERSSLPGVAQQVASIAKEIAVLQPQ